MYNIKNRTKEFGYNFTLKNGLSWEIIEKEINDMNDKLDDDIHSFTRVNKMNDLDEINYNLCTKKRKTNQK